MKNFIAEPEAYLFVEEYKDYTLTEEKEKLLNDFVSNERLLSLYKSWVCS